MPAVGVPAPDVCLVSSGLCAKAILHKTEHAIADVNGCTVADVNAVSISIRLRSTARSILLSIAGEAAGQGCRLASFRVAAVSSANSAQISPQYPLTESIQASHAFAVPGHAICYCPLGQRRLDALLECCETFRALGCSSICGKGVGIACSDLCRHFRVGQRLAKIEERTRRLFLVRIGQNTEFNLKLGHAAPNDTADKSLLAGRSLHRLDPVRRCGGEENALRFPSAVKPSRTASGQIAFFFLEKNRKWAGRDCDGAVPATLRDGRWSRAMPRRSCLRAF